MMTSDLIKNASSLAYRYYGNRRRKYSGESYYQHARDVARLSKVIGLSDELIATAFIYNIHSYSLVKSDEVIETLNQKCYTYILELTNYDGNPSLWLSDLTEVSVESRLIVLCITCVELSSFGMIHTKNMGPNTYSEQWLKKKRLQIDTINQSLLKDDINESLYKESFQSLTVVLEHMYTTANNLFDYYTLLNQSKLPSKPHLS